MRTNIIGLAAILMLTGCASTGKMDGWLTSQNQSTGHVVFHYKSDVSGNGGTITALLPDGKMYSGKYVQITSTTEEHAVAPLFGGPWGPYWRDWGAFGGPWFSGDTYQTFVTNYSGKIIATLMDGKAHIMRCRFLLSDPPRGLGGGGTGQCQVSTGGTIDVVV